MWDEHDSAVTCYVVHGMAAHGLEEDSVEYGSLLVDNQRATLGRHGLKAEPSPEPPCCLCHSPFSPVIVWRRTRAGQTAPAVRVFGKRVSVGADGALLGAPGRPARMAFQSRRQN